MKAYLIGNGASIPYGSPLGRDIFKQVLRLWYDGLQQQNNVYHQLNFPLESFLSTFDGLRRQLTWGDIQSLHRCKFVDMFRLMKNPNISLQDRLSAYHTLKQYLSQNHIWELFPEIVSRAKDSDAYCFPSLDAKRKRLIGISDCFYNDLAELSFKVIYASTEYSGLRPCLYKKFVHKLNLGGEDTLIVNLNYDTLLERSLREVSGINVIYVLGSASHMGNNRYRNGATNVFLCKPHGSFDMLYCQTCKHITLSKDVPVLQSAHTDRKDCKNCGKSNRPNFFVPYAAVDERLRYIDVLNNILSGLKQKLEKVDEILTIGYSFPEWNGQLIDRHLLDNLRGKHFTVVARTVKDGDYIAGRFCRLGFHAMNSGCDGFEEYIRFMPSSIFQ